MKTKTVKTWQNLYDFSSKNFNNFDPQGIFTIEVKKKKMTMYDYWIFRGQMDSEWDLESSYNRLLKSRPSNYKLLNNPDKRKLEELLIDIYQSYAHAYLPANELPAYEMMEEWLALMQHNGTMTRLVDWTYNFFIAVFFAVDGLQPFNNKNGKFEEKKFSIWAIRPAHFVKYTLEKVLKEEISQVYIENAINKATGRFEHFLEAENIFQDEKFKSAILQMTPLILNRRLAMQQGTFLLQSDLSNTMEKDIKKIEKNIPRPNEIFYKINFNLKEENEYIEILRQLQRLNISRQTLFQDLEGFSKSINACGMWLNPNITNRFS